MSHPDYKELIENISDWIWEVDADGVYTYCSPKVEEFLGYKAEEVIGKRAFDFMSDAEAQRVGAIFGQILLKQESFSQLENTNFHKEGHEVILETSGIPLFDENGTLKGYRGIDRDITAARKKQLEDEQKWLSEVEKNRKQEAMLLQQSRLSQMGEMLSLIAHQWRQPLSAITSSLIAMKMELLLEKNPPASMIEKIDKIESYATFLSETITTFRNFFKVTQKPESFMLEEIITMSTDIIRDSVENNGIAFNVSIENDVRVTSYKNELSQVILNLLKNAVDALIMNGVASPRLTLCAHAAKKKAYISVEDNAGGIPPQVIPKIFEPYYSTKESNGTGLGLYLSKMIVEEHCKGELTVESNYLYGSKFTIALGR